MLFSNPNAIPELHPPRAWQIAGIPFVLTSAYKSAGWDKRKGRPETRPHALGKAMDIRRHSLQNRFKIVNALLQISFKRMDIAESFTHAGTSPLHTQNIVWLY